MGEDDRQDSGPIVAFFRGESTDDRGRSLDTILQWDDDRLERVHDFIQWLFPLDAPSGVNPGAPLVGAREQRAFESDPLLRNQLRRALDRMLAFYGFQVQRDTTGAPVSIDRSAAFAARAHNWLTPGNHNHLRLTRILRSLRLLGLQQEARMLYGALTAIGEEDGGRSISQVTRDFWRRAALTGGSGIGEDTAGR
jgi:hypothetical protein